MGQQIWVSIDFVVGRSCSGGFWSVVVDGDDESICCSGEFQFGFCLFIYFYLGSKYLVINV